MSGLQDDRIKDVYNSRGEHAHLVDVGQVIIILYLEESEEFYAGQCIPINTKIKIRKKLYTVIGQEKVNSSGNNCKHKLTAWVCDVEKIAHAAWRRKDGKIAIAKQHGDCIRKSPPDTCMKGSWNQGFITDKGRYVGRVEASKIAFKAGQIDTQPRILFSEHMWHKKFNGKHKYDTDKGYVLEELRR